ncbi:MAG: hypothetical protein ACI4JF_09570 [Oscillospiraceae bacterium]
MSFFDKLEKAAKAVEKIVESSGALSEARSAFSAPRPAESAPKDPILESASVPPKPDFKAESSFGDKVFSFELSGDFIEFNSHCEMEPSYQYEPYSTENYTEYDGKLPVIAIGPNDTVFNEAVSYEGGGPLPSGAKSCESPSFLFSMQFSEHNKKIYAYAFSGGTARAHEMLFLEYDPSVAGTALEKKLFSILDRAAETYIEWGR